MYISGGGVMINVYIRGRCHGKCIYIRGTCHKCIYQGEVS